VPDRELGRERSDRGGRNVVENGPRDVLAVVLLGERPAEVVLVHGPPLEKERSDPTSREVLDPEGPGEVVLRDEVGSDQDLAQSGHAFPSIITQPSRRAGRAPGFLRPPRGPSARSGAASM
jgi:hypothetical protein